MRSDLIEIEVFVVCTTEKAALVNSQDTGAEDVWLPKASFEWSEGERGLWERGYMADITISRRYAEEKGLA